MRRHVRVYVDHVFCAACMQYFHTVERVVKHLCRSMKCKLFYTTQFDELDDDKIALVEACEKERSHEPFAFASHIDRCCAS